MFFMLCAEIISHILRESDDIKGITVHDEESKVSQCANDTTLTVAEDLQSVTNVIKVLKWF